MKIDKLEALIQLMKDSDLKILSIEDQEMEIYLEAHSKETAKETSQASPQTTQQDTQSSSDTSEGATDLIEVRATQIGVFYTQPDEDSTDTFVSVGDKVETGDQIGLIETMKIFNEVHVKDSGVIEEILVENGEPVEFDQVVMRLRKEGD